MKRILFLFCVGALLMACLGGSTDRAISILVFSKTAGFRHESIQNARDLIRQLGLENNFKVEFTEDAAEFRDDRLSQFNAVVFALTTGDVLNNEEQAAFERFIAKGGGFVGIHSATDTEYDWPWYGGLVGAYFKSHPIPQLAVIKVEDNSHPSTRPLPKPTWTVLDEWYNFRTNPRGRVKVLAVLDETSYSGGEMGQDHPIIWCQEYNGGRAWYTGLGHRMELYTDPIFQQHLLGGILYASNKASDSCTR